MKTSTADLLVLMAHAEALVNDTNSIIRAEARLTAKLLRARLNRRSRSDALRSLGLTRCVVNGRVIWE